MKAWAQNHYPDVQIPLETQWFAKLALALDLHEIDESVVDRQRPLWLEELAEMANARNAAPSGTNSTASLPKIWRIGED